MICVERYNLSDPAKDGSLEIVIKQIHVIFKYIILLEDI